MSIILLYFSWLAASFSIDIIAKLVTFFGTESFEDSNFYNFQF